MFRLHAIDAKYGDCLLLEYGTGKSKYILIDGGPGDVWATRLQPTLKRLGYPRLEAVVLTHVDTDHTNGLVEMFATIQTGAPKIEIDGLWMNAFGDVVDPDGSIHQEFAQLSSDVSSANIALAAWGVVLNGVSDGNNLRVRADQLKIPRNAKWSGSSILVGKTPPFKLGNLTFTVVGPTQTNLDALKAEWKDWLADQRVRFNANRPTFAAMADKSVPNLSSVQLLVEGGGRSLLLTGDGRGDHLLAGLEAADRLDDDGCIDVDVLKLPHHGSDRNVTRGFFERVRATTYVVSADGRHGNPDTATLQWIVETANEAERKVTIVATNQTPSIDRLQKGYPPKEWGYKLKLRPDSRHAITVDI